MYVCACVCEEGVFWQRQSNHFLTKTKQKHRGVSLRGTATKAIISSLSHLPLARDGAEFPREK